MTTQDPSNNPNLQKLNTQNPNIIGNPFIGIHMKCCNTYVRAYLNAAGNAYSGRCPRCATPVQIDIVSEGGSRSRFFEAS